MRPPCSASTARGSACRPKKDSCGSFSSRRSRSSPKSTTCWRVLRHSTCSKFSIVLSERDYRRRMFETVLTVAGVGVLLAVLWAAREALMLVYVSALVAMGFAPLVDIIEQPRPNVRRRVPRWLAILAIYLAIVAAFVMLGLMVIPPLVAQASALWDRLPDEFNQLQNFLIRYKLLTRRITLADAVSNTPSRAGSDPFGTVLVSLAS